MATKQPEKKVKVTTKVTTFEERTKQTKPWEGTIGVDDTRPDPQIVKEK